MKLFTKNKNISQNETNKVARNLLWMVWSAAISIANSVVLWIFLARMRDVEEMGRFTIVMGLYALFYNVCSLGLMPYLVNEISRRNERSENGDYTEKRVKSLTDFISGAAMLLLLSSASCAFLMTVCGFLVSDSFSVHLSALILSLAIIPSGLICVGEATAISFEKTRLIAFVSTVENVLRTVVPFVLIWLGFDIPTICSSFVIVRFAALVPYLWAARSKLKFFDYNSKDFKKITKVSPTFAGTITLASVNWQSAIILLGLLSTETESAKYGVASRFLIPVTILMASYANVIQPALARHAQNSNASAGAYLSKMLSYPLILSISAAFVSPFLSVQVLTLLFGSSYGESSTTLNVLAMSVVPFCLVMIISRGLVAMNSQHIDLFANALGVITSITVGLITIPRYGAIGAAFAQMLSFFLMALFETVYLSKKIIGFHFWQKACISSIFLATTHFIIWKL